MNRRDFTLTASAFALAACGPKPEAAAKKGVTQAPAPPGSLAWAARGSWRLEPERDQFRHPVETLNFFGIQPNMTVVEIFPGRGWYTSILAPYLARGGGRLVCAGFDPLTASDAQIAILQEFKDRFMKDKSRYGDIEMTVLSDKTGAIAPPASADMILVMRNVHTFMAEGYAERAFADFLTALKPGGVLGVEEHRAKSTGLQDPQAGDGYVQEAYVKLLAQEAGFEFVGSSEINANPKDTKDHPYGVWTLPPVLRSAPLGLPPSKDFDSAKYVAIGESDRMTLKFRKPPAAPPSEPLRGSMSPDR
jgi:predicted methyltransferase